ncbi:hypothetical protein EKE94_08385 [Mesobaculum littorinae]|uniref:Cytochrome oxidase subunit II copper A binding domain-containing protein n=2 Tax=Mesobaculum littorinae TaxID=2486419 RepID=A0A438AK66_9RHOB|nr:hypothetical protein EKE94_08385 [Mesobaculum littorinae]
MLAGSSLIFVFVMGLIALAWRRPPDTPPDTTPDGARDVGTGTAPHGVSDGLSDGAPNAGSGIARDAARRETPEGRFVIGLGLAFPLAVLAALLAYGLVVGERLMPRAGPDTVTVSAEGRQWDWRFGYADAPGIETRDVLHIPAATPVDVRITTVDVVHSFWVPRLAGKLDAVPGHTNVLRIEADAPGRYAGLGAEYNGPGYLGHDFTVIAHGPADWQAFLRGDITEGVAADTAKTDRRDAEVGTGTEAGGGSGAQTTAKAPSPTEANETATPEGARSSPSAAGAAPGNSAGTSPRGTTGDAAAVPAPAAPASAPGSAAATAPATGPQDSPRQGDRP